MLKHLMETPTLGDLGAKKQDLVQILSLNSLKNEAPMSRVRLLRPVVSQVHCSSAHAQTRLTGCLVLSVPRTDTVCVWI